MCDSCEFKIVVSSNTAHEEVYSIHCVIKFVSDLRGSFHMVIQFLSPINWQPRYNWNNVESGVRNHNPHWTHCLHEQSLYYWWLTRFICNRLMIDQNVTGSFIKRWLSCKSRDMYCFSAKHASLGWKRKDWMSRN